MNTLPILMEKEQSLENNALFGKKTMTTKELADVLGVHRDTINATVKEMELDGKIRQVDIKRNSQGGYLFNELQVTAIKKELESHSKVNELSPKTELEKTMLVMEAMQYLQESKAKLEKELADAQPALHFFKSVTGSKDTIDIGTVAKVLDKNIGRNKLFEILRNKNILDRNNKPYQAYIDRGYFRVIETSYTTPDGDTHINCKTVVYQKGVDFINRLLEKEVANG